MMWAAQLEYAGMYAGDELPERMSLTAKEYAAFSGIGAIACTTGGRSAATAFLVGGFDIAVTVAHIFERNGRWATPAECFYASVGPAGQIRERIPLRSIKTQWALQPDTFGHPASDLAVVRLSRPARLAQRTLSLTRFSQTHAPVLLVGFRADLGLYALKRKARGRVYPRTGGACIRFAHDVDSRGLTAGAPLIDVRDGVVIGIHMRLAPRRAGRSSDCMGRGNAMIMMNEWLEHTIRAEMASSPMPRGIESTAGH